MAHRITILPIIALGVVAVLIGSGLAYGLTIGEIVVMPFRWMTSSWEWLYATLGPWPALTILIVIAALLKQVLPSR